MAHPAGTFHKLEAVEVTELEQRGDSLFFTCTYITPELLPKELIEKFYHTLEGKPIDYRHIEIKTHPAAMLGKFHRAWLDDAKMKAEAEVFGLTNVQTEVQRLMRAENLGKDEKKLDGVSAYYITYTPPGESKPVSVEFLGGGLTPNPLCKECRVDAILNESIILVENEQTEQTETTETSESEEETETTETTETTQTEQTETVTEPPGELDSTETSVPPDTSTPPPENLTEKELRERLIGNEVVTEELRRVAEKQAQELATQGKELADLKAWKAEQEAAPIREDILKLEGITDEDEKKARVEELKQLDASALGTVLRVATTASKAAKAVTMVSEQSAGTAKIGEGVDVTMKQFEEMTPEAFALKFYKPEDLGLSKDEADKILGKQEGS